MKNLQKYLLLKSNLDELPHARLKRKTPFGAFATC